MKVVFLDIDGVTRSGRWEEHIRLNGPRDGSLSQDFDPKAIEYLNELVARSGAKVVISSSWRQMEIEGDAVVADLLYERGFTGEVIGKTPIFGLRHDEITAWLQDNKVEGICILDDLTVEYLNPWLVQTTWADGLLPEHVEKALLVLELPPPANGVGRPMERHEARELAWRLRQTFHIQGAWATELGGSGVWAVDLMLLGEEHHQIRALMPPNPLGASVVSL